MPKRREYTPAKQRRQAAVLAFVRCAERPPTSAEIHAALVYSPDKITRDLMQFEHDGLIERLPVKRIGGRSGCSLRWKAKEPPCREK